MPSSKDIIAQAANGQVKRLADALDVTLSRMYELLSKDNPYPKLWRILRPLGRLNPEGLRLVQADFNTRCAALLADVERAPVSAAQIHQELSEVVQAHLADRPVDAQRKELIEARLVIEQRLDELNQLGSSQQSVDSIQ